MKKQLLAAVALLATLSELSAGIIGNALGTAENITEDVLDVPGDVLYGPNRPYRRGVLLERNYSNDFGDYNPEL